MILGWAAWLASAQQAPPEAPSVEAPAVEATEQEPTLDDGLWSKLLHARSAHQRLALLEQARNAKPDDRTLLRATFVAQRLVSALDEAGIDEPAIVMGWLRRSLSRDPELRDAARDALRTPGKLADVPWSAQETFDVPPPDLAPAPPVVQRRRLPRPLIEGPLPQAHEDG